MLAARRALLVVVSALIALVAPGDALAWVETHVLRDDVTMELGADGVARVEHRVVLKVAGGPLPTLDLRGVDADAVPEPGALLVPERAAQKKSLDGAEPVTLEVVTPKARDGEPAQGPSLRMRFAGRGLGRGSYVITARYRTDLRARGVLTLDGALGTLAWKGAISPEGLDAARLTLTLPAGATPPAALAEEGAEGAPVVLSTVARVGTSDRIELVRPYAPKEEAVTWRVRFDARALGGGPAAAPAPPPERTIARALGGGGPRAVVPTLVFVVGAAAFVALALLAFGKTIDARRTAAGRGAAARPLVPAPAPLRAVLLAAAFVGGAVAVGVHGRVVLGASCFAAAGLLGWFRPARAPRAPLRAAGKWLVVSEREATARPAFSLGSPVDASTPLGLAALVAASALVGLGISRLREAAPYHTLLLAVGATALLPLFLTGRRDQLPPDPMLDARPTLRAVAARVMKRLRPYGARLVGRIHVPVNGRDPDELRLALVPRTRPPGLAAIELAVGFAEVGGGWVPVPEILVRARTGSPTDELLRERFEGVAHDRGERREGERVVSFSPKVPTAAAVAELWLAIFVAVSGDQRAPTPARARPPRAAPAIESGLSQAVGS